MPHISSWYRAGDVAAGMALGASIAMVGHVSRLETLPWALRITVSMVLAMALQAVFATLLGAILGHVELAVPGFVTAMIGMWVPELTDSLSLQMIGGALIGANTFLMFEIWDVSLQGTPLQTLTITTARWSPPGRLRCWWYDFRQRGGNRRRAWIQRRLLLSAKGNVLLAGAGTGLNLMHFPKQEAMTITAVDLDPALLAEAQRRGGKLGLELLCLPADLERLPFRDDTFDTVVSIATLCRVASPQAVLSEYRRVLAPDGMLLLFEHVKSTHPLVGPFMSTMDFFRTRTSSSMSRQTLHDVQVAGFMVASAVCGYADIYLAITAKKLNQEETQLSLVQEDAEVVA